MFVSVIIVAAGKGTRIGSDKPKQFIEINGKPIIAYTLDKFENCTEVDEIIVVSGDLEYFSEHVIKANSYKKIKCTVTGGKERQDSVYNGLCQVSPVADIILVHDGARPFVSKENIVDVINGANKFGSCILGVEVTDTIKLCDENMKILNTPNRKNLWAVQTPQGFRHEILQKAYKQAITEGFYGTDDASLVERTGQSAYIVRGSYENIKITTENDLEFIRWIFERRIYK